MSRKKQKMPSSVAVGFLLQHIECEKPILLSLSARIAVLLRHLCLCHPSVSAKALFSGCSSAGLSDRHCYHDIS